MSDQGFSFSYEQPLHDAFPALHEAQSAWLGQVESLQALDRKTHELVRMVCMVIARNPGGVHRHAQLAAEVGATWEEVAAAVVLTEPGFGVLPAAQALPHARAGYEEGVALVAADRDDDD